MKLISLQVVGVDENSWSSEKLVFGERMTQLFGPNGSGKTPLVQSIVFALGYKVDFRDDILDKCDFVTLRVGVGVRELLIRRKLRGSFDVTVEEKDGTTAEFVSEREYSRFLLSLWGLEDPVLTTVSNSATHIYSPQILPLFYLDQDRGYADEYYAAQKFIKSQYAEAMRLVYGLVPRNSFDKRRARNELKEKLEYLDRRVVRLETIMGELMADLGVRRPIDEIDRELASSIEGLEELRASGGMPERVAIELDSRIAALQLRKRDMAVEKGELEARVRGFTQIRHEIEIEAGTLSLNEEARRVFASFDAICANADCGLFVRSSASYGKSLLYLKDQVKDLERSNASHQRRVGEIIDEIGRLDAQLAVVKIERDGLVTASSVTTLVEVVSQLTERVIELKQARKLEAELASVETDYVGRLDEREKVQARLAALERGPGGTDLELLAIRNSLRELILFWLTVLRTSNVSTDIQVDGEFNVTFGGQKVSKFKGSTLTRIILAIRTAAFDLVVRRAEAVPRFFILDTPRQQDISRDDLAEYIRQLQMLAAERSVQVILSTTNHRYELGAGDVEWVPAFPGEEHEMFLGVKDVPVV